jgi:hypothetical protein
MPKRYPSVDDVVKNVAFENVVVSGSGSVSTAMETNSLEFVKRVQLEEVEHTRSFLLKLVNGEDSNGM